MRMRLLKLQDDDKEAKKLKSEGLLESWKIIKQVLYYQAFNYVLKNIWSKLISGHYDNLIASHFSIEITRALIAKKYYRPMLQQDVEVYVKGCNI